MSRLSANFEEGGGDGRWCGVGVAEEEEAEMKMDDDDEWVQVNKEDGK